MVSKCLYNGLEIFGIVLRSKLILPYLVIHTLLKRGQMLTT